MPLPHPAESQFRSTKPRSRLSLEVEDVSRAVAQVGAGKGVPAARLEPNTHVPSIVVAP